MQIFAQTYTFGLVQKVLSINHLDDVSIYATFTCENRKVLVVQSNEI